MPNSVERALADALSLEHADVPWSLPPALPSAADLRTAVAALTVPATDPKHAAFCLAKLMVAFGSKLSPEDTKLQAALWLEANGDLGNELWSKATIGAIRESKWMPKPAEFRAQVARELAEQSKRLTRCQAMLKALGEGVTADKPKAFVPDDRKTMLPLLIKSSRYTGRHAQAVKFAKELAELTGEPLPDWATVSPAVVPLKREEPEAVIPVTAAGLAMRDHLAELAQAHRARQGFGVSRETQPVDGPIYDRAEAV